MVSEVPLTYELDLRGQALLAEGTARVQAPRLWDRGEVSERRGREARVAGESWLGRWWRGWGGTSQSGPGATGRPSASPERVGAQRVSGALACSDLHLWHRAHYFHPIGRVGKLRHGGVGEFAQGHTAGGAGAQA